MTTVWRIEVASSNTAVLNHGAEVEARGKEEGTALHLAAINGQLKMARKP
jgi:ankyrin repeat protein